MGRATRRSMRTNSSAQQGAGQRQHARVRRRGRRLQDAPGEQGQRGGEAERAAPVQAGRPRVARFAQRGRGDRQRDRADQRARQEHRPPAQRVQQRSGQHRPGGQAHAEAGAEQAEGARAALVGIGLVQRRRAAGQRGGCGRACTARSASSQIVSGARPSASDISTNRPTPRNTRRPQASASAPAISRLPKLSMKALVIQASACGPPPRSRPMAGVARAPPAKLNGISARPCRRPAGSRRGRVPGWGASAWLWRGRAA